jgi:Protein of unknown function (DUF2934)
MKNHHHQHPAESTDNSPHIIHEVIANRAYAIWIESGMPDNQADSHWLEAEQEQITGKRAARADGAEPVSF